MRIHIACLLLLAVPAWAQEPPADGSSAGRRTLTAGIADAPVRIDGRFDEPAWSAAEVARDFTQAYPAPGAPATQRTEVRVLVGTDAVYVAARMFDTRPDSIAAQLSRRDVSGTYSDRVLLFLDSQDDRRTGFHFAVNPRGVKQDAYLSDDSKEDASWDAVWDVATTVDSLGWTAEFRIPFSQLRFPDRTERERVWGLGLMREIARSQERATWSPWTRDSPGFVSSFGELRGITSVRPARRLEILPYSSARLERAPDEGANPFYRRNALAGSAGADVNYGLPGGLTLSATVNPDFGQVEADPAEVNLTAFESFFSERRPFFVEGSDVFRFGDLSTYNNTYSGHRFFYSRRVGRAPQRSLAGHGYDFVDAPDQSTILAAAKVSGKTGKGWSVGLMNAVTAREEARFLDGAGSEGAAPVEPLSNYFVGRLRRDLHQGNTVVGGIVTATHRDMRGDEFDGMLRSRAYLAGVDGLHTWNRRTWALSGFLAGSRIEGAPAVIGATQLSSARYYQRPDTDYLVYDSTRTALGGVMGGVALRRSGAWRGSLAYQVATPGFEINDAGYQNRVDFHSLATQVGRRVQRPGRVFRDYMMQVFTNHAWNFGGDRTYDLYSAGGFATFRNLWTGNLTLHYSPRTLDDRLTRGGPLAETPASWQVSLRGGTDPRKKVGLNASGGYGESTEGTYVRSLGVSASIRPSTSLQLSLGPSLYSARYDAQYVLTRSDPLATETFGQRYVFAKMEQTVFSFDTRVNWTFTPNLSLQLYAQPFVASGDFSDYKEFLAPGEYEFGVYGKDRGTIGSNEPCGDLSAAPGVHTVDPDGAGPASCFQIRDRDFNFRSLRGNAVLRWEYRPGSSVFLVWQQLRSGQSRLGDFDLGRDVGGILGEPARNIFLVKMTYWIGR